MSVETFKAMQDAIAAHLADENDAILTGWVLKMEGRTIKGIDEGYAISRWETPETQSVITTVGLTRSLYVDIDDWYRHGREIDDDD